MLLDKPAFKKILVIDDDRTFLKSILTVLDKKAEVSTATTREAFLALFENQQFDLLITDYKMNFWDGLEVIEHVKRKQPSLPIIIISAFADKDMAIKCANLQVHRILEKPIDLQTFYRAIDDAFTGEKNSIRLNGLSYGPVKLQEENFLVDIHSEKVQLTETEFKILKILIQNVDKRVAREDFQKRLWGSTHVSPNVLDTHLVNLKRKVPLIKEKLQNIRGRGYFLPVFEI